MARRWVNIRHDRSVSGISFFLWVTKGVADKAKAHFDQTGCGEGCNPVLHKGVDLGKWRRTIYERSHHVDITL